MTVADLSGGAGRARADPRTGPRDAASGPGPDAEPGTEGVGSAPAEAGETAALEAALDLLAPRWADDAADGDLPSPGRLATLRRRFHELGAANPFAVDEYRAVRERLETLDAQDKDLREAITKTRALIADLDVLIATQFRTTFAALEVAFDARFQQLFGGGFARLSLTDPTDLSATGIEITARPPGKKPQALSMLSGGERALTAVALLFAMLEVRPAPFCVLDEVDAALDEANVGRFTEALRELAARTQFIVITHNRGTIEAADALYGVTVGDDSVSRVISLRLDEAQAIAEPPPHRGPRGPRGRPGRTSGGEGLMQLFHHDHKGEDPEREPAERCRRRARGHGSIALSEGGLEPDLIGDEWKQGSPDEAVPEPNELEWDLAEAPGALLGGRGEVDPAPIVPMPEVKEHGREDEHR